MQQLKFHKNISSKKIKRRYRLSFYSENTLHELWSIKFTRTRVFVAAVVIVLAMSSLISTIIVSTPLRTYLPGYIKSEQRHEYITATMRMDSLEAVIAYRNQYFENLSDILNDEVNPIDSLVQPDSIFNLYSDSLLAATELEKQFVKDFDEKEQFNIAVLTPLAAQRLVFATPIYAEPDTKSINKDLSEGVSIPAPKGSPVASIYDGTAISVDRSVTGVVQITIQHPEGFISKYRNLANSYVTKGSKISAAQRIGTTSSDILQIELWHNGIAVNPLSYIPF